MQGTPVLQNYGAQRVPQAENNINAAKLLPSACLHPILETRTLCAVLWIFRECSLRPRAVPFRRRWPRCAYTRPAPQHWRPPGPWRQTTPELGSPGTDDLRRLPLQLAGSYPGGFLERNFETLLSECTKKGLSHTKAFLAATCWGLAPHKSTDRSSTHVSAVATAFWLSTLIGVGFRLRPAASSHDTGQSQPARCKATR